MTVHLWRIATDTPDYTADDMTGKGAEITGGRWNRQGLPVVYCASNIALAALETLAHLNAGDMPLNRYLVRIDVPDDIWAARRVGNPASVGVGWDASPPGKVSMDEGDKWLKSGAHVLYEVPSVIVPEESNVLINPQHTDALRLLAIKLRRWTYDSRTR